MFDNPNDGDEALPKRHVSLKDGDLFSPIDLRDFLGGLGTVMQLPQKAAASARREPAEKNVAADESWSRRNRRALIALTIAAVAVGAFAARPLMPQKPATAPPELQGRWTASDPAFVGRSLEIGVHEVAIGRGPGDVGTFVLTQVKRTAKTEGERFVLAYRGTDQVEDELALDYNALPHPQLRLKNRPEVVWQRTTQ